MPHEVKVVKSEGKAGVKKKYYIKTDFAREGDLKTANLGDITQRKAHVRSLVNGAAFLDSHNVLDIDRKLGNALLGSDGKAYLSDLGGAKIKCEPDDHLYTLNDFVFSPYYLPFEDIYVNNDLARLTWDQWRKVSSTLQALSYYMILTGKREPVVTTTPFKIDMMDLAKTREMVNQDLEVLVTEKKITPKMKELLVNQFDPAKRAFPEDFAQSWLQEEAG
jgi:hypothetical protein